jgi:transposase
LFFRLKNAIILTIKTAIQNIPSDINKSQKLLLSKLAAVEKLQQDFAKNKEQNHILAKKCKKQEEYIESLIHDINVLRKMLYGPKADKYIPPLPSNQLTFADLDGDLFSNDDEEAPPANEEEFEEISYSRKKKKKGRKKLPENLPREVIEHDLTKEEKTCLCGKCRPLMDVEITERLRFKPAELVVEQHKYPVYGQCNCDNLEKDELPGVISTPREPRIIPKSIATPSLLSYIFTSKFVDGMPFYRLNKQFERYGISLSRQNMSNWAIKVMPQIERLLPLLKKHIFSGQLINIDETPFQVLSEPGKKATTKSYMWLMYGGPPDSKAILYNYSPSRSGTVAKELLEDYVGCVQTDAYAAYLYLNSEEDILHVTCLAHVRRKFVDLQISLNKSSFRKNKKSINNVEKILRLIRLEMTTQRLSPL